MYTTQQSKVVRGYANWLQETDWDIFSTVTYQYDVKPKQNHRIMMGVEEYLKSLKNKFKMFWVMEHTNYRTSTHNHLLIKGEGVEQEVEYHLRSKGLITDKVKHLPYEKGASLYVAKYLCDSNAEYNIVESK